MGLRRAAVPPHRARIAQEDGPVTAFGRVSTPSRIVERRIAASSAVGCVRRWRSVAVDDRVVAAADRAPERDAEGKRGQRDDPECGSDTSGFSWEIDQDHASFDINFPQGQTPLLRTGTFPLDSAEVIEGYGDGGILGWQTPPGACTVTITRSICVSVPSVAQNWDWIQGSGQCTQPAQPTEAKGAAAPVTIGDFSFRGYVLFP
jgi:hypothetical protein